MCKFSGIVEHGKGLGRTVGMPTANIGLDSVVLMEGTFPESGVYASKVSLEGFDGVFDGLTNIGKRPSVDDSEKVTVETLILDFDADLYGKKMTLEITDFIRNIKKFASLEEVKNQVERDKEFIKAISKKGLQKSLP